MSIRRESIETGFGKITVEYSLWRGCAATQYRACVSGQFVAPVVYRRGSLKELYTLVHSKARLVNFQQNHYDGWRAVQYEARQRELRKAQGQQ